MANALYYSPGQELSGGVWGSPLYRLSAQDGTPTLLATFDASDDELITQIFQASDDTVYVFTSTYEGNSNYYSRVYSFDVGASTATELAVWHYVSGTDDRANPVVQVCEFGGKLYLATNSIDGAPWQRVECFDPTDNSITTVLNWDSIPSSAYFGGVGTDGTTIFATDGHYVYRSTTGNSGDWSLDKNLRDFCGGNDGFVLFHRPSGNMLASPEGWGVMPPPNSNLAERDGVGNWTGTSVGGATACPLIAYCHDGTGTFTVDWPWEDHWHLWRQPDAGAWANDTDSVDKGVGIFVVGASQGLAWFDGYLFILAYYYTNDETYLYRRDSAGNLTTIQTHTGFTDYGSYTWIGAMCVIDEPAVAGGRSWAMLVG